MAAGLIRDVEIVLLGMIGCPEISPVLAQVQLDQVAAAVFDGDVMGV